MSPQKSMANGQKKKDYNDNRKKNNWQYVFKQKLVDSFWEFVYVHILNDEWNVNPVIDNVKVRTEKMQNKLKIMLKNHNNKNEKKNHVKKYVWITNKWKIKLKRFVLFFVQVFVLSFCVKNSTLRLQ